MCPCARFAIPVFKRRRASEQRSTQYPVRVFGSAALQCTGYDPAEMDLPGNVPPQMADFARREIADYYGCCTGLDAQMGRLLAALDTLGIAADTIVYYTSDHGDPNWANNWIPLRGRRTRCRPVREPRGSRA